MLARTPSTVRLIGAGLTSIGAVAAVLLAPGNSKAQQLAANADITADRHTYIVARCGPIEQADVACVAKTSIEYTQARTEMAKQATAAAKKGVADEAVLRTCLTYLQQQRAGGKTFDRTITRENACAYARELGLRGGPG